MRQKHVIPAIYSIQGSISLCQAGFYVGSSTMREKLGLRGDFPTMKKLISYFNLLKNGSGQNCLHIHRLGCSERVNIFANTDEL